MPLPSMTREKAKDLLERFKPMLDSLDKKVDESQDCSILEKQIASSILRAIESIAHDTPFFPTLLKHGEACLAEGVFGSPPDAGQCLALIFSRQTSKNNYRDILIKLAKKMLEGKELHQFLEFDQAITPKSINSSTLNIISTVLTPDTLAPYIKVLQELFHYAPSLTLEKQAQEDVNRFSSQSKRLFACLKTLQSMYQEGKIDQALAEKTIIQFKNEVDTILYYFDKPSLYHLEGKNNTKENQRDIPSLVHRFLYQLAVCLRFIFMVISFGYMRQENPLAKQLGYGHFFIYKPKTQVEIKDIHYQKEVLAQLRDKISGLKEMLTALSSEISELSVTAPSIS